jgi:hypothetical protein
MVARELGIMQLSDDGMWIDTPLCMAEREAADVALPPAIPDEWLEHLEEVQSPPPLGAAADGLPAAEPLPVPTAVELP